jgi:HAD superfamily hydrolase (TIGR01549 family)
MDSKKIIFFDFANTLGFLKPSSETLIYKFFKKKISKKRIKNAISELDNNIFYSSLKIKNLNQKKIFYIKYNTNLLVKLRLKKNCAKNAKLLFYYFQKFQRKWVIDLKTKNFLIKIREKFELGIASNFDSSLRKILTKNKIIHLFKHIIISKEKNCEKPNPNFFKLMKLKAKNNKIIFIGDNFSLDYKPALQNNIQALIISDKKKKLLKKYEINRSLLINLNSQILKKIQ